MSPQVTLAIAQRVLWQIRRDPRTIAMLLVVPVVLLTLLKFVFEGQASTFQAIGAPMCGLFPFVIMFLITSIAMLRERTTGTLERLMTLPMESSTCSPGTVSLSGFWRRSRRSSCASSVFSRLA